MTNEQNTCALTSLFGGKIRAGFREVAFLLTPLRKSATVAAKNKTKKRINSS